MASNRLDGDADSSIGNGGWTPGVSGLPDSIGNDEDDIATGAGTARAGTELGRRNFLILAKC